MTTIPTGTHRRLGRLPAGLMAVTASLFLEATGGLAAATQLVRGGGAGALSAAQPSILLRGTLAAPPVMLVHGLASDCSTLQAMARSLHAAGHTVYLVNYSSVGVDIPAGGRILAVEAARLREATGAAAFHVVAHSLGGVLARWAIGNTRMGRSVETAITLASPHGGSPLARLAPAGMPGFATLIQQLRPDSPDRCGTAEACDPAPRSGTPATHMPPPSPAPTGSAAPDAPGGSALDPPDRPAPDASARSEHSGARPDQVRWVTVSGQLDWVVPPRYAALPERADSRAIVLSGCGHLSLPSDPRCIEIVRRELARSIRSGQSLARAA
jgi:pimeloyl-ACP methyl ester carboxylesterase